MTAQEHEDFRIEVLRKRVADAGKRETEAMLDKHRALAELAKIRGDEREREYHEAYVAAQTYQPGGHAQFMAICYRNDAARIIAGTETLDDHPARERPAIAAEMERLRGEAPDAR